MYRKLLDFKFSCPLQIKRHEIMEWTEGMAPVNLFFFEIKSQRFTVLDYSFTTIYLFLNLLNKVIWTKPCVKTATIPSFLMRITLDKSWHSHLWRHLFRVIPSSVAIRTHHLKFSFSSHLHQRDSQEKHWIAFQWYASYIQSS